MNRNCPHCGAPRKEEDNEKGYVTRDIPGYGDVDFPISKAWTCGTISYKSGDARGHNCLMDELEQNAEYWKNNATAVACEVADLRQRNAKLEKQNAGLRGVASEVASWEGLNFTDRSGIIPRASKALKENGDE